MSVSGYGVLGIPTQEPLCLLVRNSIVVQEHQHKIPPVLTVNVTFPKQTLGWRGFRSLDPVDESTTTMSTIRSYFGVVILAVSMVTTLDSAKGETRAVGSRVFTEEHRRLCEVLLNKGTEQYLLGDNLEISERFLRGALRIAEEWTRQGGEGEAVSFARQVCLQARLFLGNLRCVTTAETSLSWTPRTVFRTTRGVILSAHRTGITCLCRLWVQYKPTWSLCLSCKFETSPSLRRVLEGSDVKARATYASAMAYRPYVPHLPSRSLPPR